MWQAESPRLVLASGSAGRRSLLEQAGLRCTVRPAAIDEDAVKSAARAKGAAPEACALILAEMKAARAAAADDGALIIGCDQLLVCEGRWFDKPASVDDAADQLRALRGRQHTLVTAVLCIRAGRRVWQHVAQPKLLMRDFSDDFLAAYLARAGGAVMASVGAYQIEGLGLHLFERIDGDQPSIIGLPLLPLLGFLRQHGVLVP